MKVPFYDLSFVREKLKADFLGAASNLMDKSSFIGGDAVRNFEQEYAAFNEVKFCVGAGNGFDALRIALKAIGIKHGDKVIVPAHTFTATWMAVADVGAVPVPCDVDAATFNLDAKLLEQISDEKIKAVIPVHIYGLACNMDEIMKIAADRSWKVIEDNAQAHGATSNGKLTGSFGAINATSFYPGKILGALGDGGAVTTNDESLAINARQIANYGSPKKYVHETLGFNSRLDAMQAAFLSIKLKQLNEWIEERKRIANRYTAQLNGIAEIQLQTIPDGHTHTYHLYVVLTREREKLQQYLSENGIETLIHYPQPPHLQHAFQYLGYKKGDFLVAEKISAQTLSLPLFIGITDEQIDYVANKVAAFFH